MEGRGEGRSKHFGRMFSPQTDGGLHSKRVMPVLTVSPASVEDADRTKELEELEWSLVVLSLKRGERNIQPNGTDLNYTFFFLLSFLELMFSTHHLEKSQQKTFTAVRPLRRSRLFQRSFIKVATVPGLQC